MDEIDRWIPDWPFDEDDWYLGYRRFHPAEEAREYARKMMTVVADMRNELREQHQQSDVKEWPRLFVDDRILASMAMTSHELASKVKEYQEAEWEQALASYREGLLVREGRNQDSPVPRSIEQKVDDLREELVTQWNALCDRVADQTYEQ